MSFSPDGSLLAVGFVDDTIRLWRTKDWGLDRTFKRNALAAPRSVSISPDGKRLVSFAKGITTWDIVQGKLVSHSQGETHDYLKAPTFVAGYDLAAIRHSDRFSGQVTHVELWMGSLDKYDVSCRN
jgi:WD40 repeat protein